MGISIDRLVVSEMSATAPASAPEVSGAGRVLRLWGWLCGSSADELVSDAGVRFCGTGDDLACQQWTALARL